MNQPHKLLLDDLAFTGVGRLFPLPQLVMFPHVVQALHVFEPRYRELVDDALAGDQLITLATCLTDVAADCCCRSPISPSVCLTRVISRRRLADGRCDILVLGLQRARIVSEKSLVRPYREAELELIHDEPAGSLSYEYVERRNLLREMIRQYLVPGPCWSDSFRKFLSEQQDLGMLTDLLSYSLSIPVAAKLTLLGETNVLKRADILLQAMAPSEEISSGPSTVVAYRFPPSFSGN